LKPEKYTKFTPTRLFTCRAVVIHKKGRVSITTKIMSNNKPEIPGKVQCKRPRQSKHQASTEEDKEEDIIAEEAQHLKLDGSESQQEEDKKMTATPEVPPKKKRKRRPPLIPWKKPKDMPRRPLSAYNIFFKEQRKMMMTMASKEGGDSRKTSKSKKSSKSPGIGFANLAKTIAVKWKELPPEPRAPYEAHAAIEKDRYNKEMVVWRAKQKDEKEKAEKEKALLADNSRYTGVARREDIAASSPVRVHPSEATGTWPPVAEALLGLSPSSQQDHQSSLSELVARRPEHEQSTPHRKSYRGVGPYTDRRNEARYNPAIEYGHQGEQPYPVRGGPLVHQDSYRRASWSEATHPLEVHPGFDVPVEASRPNFQERHFSESSGTPGSYPPTWFEVQQPRETAEIDDHGEGKWPARKPDPELSGPIVSKHHAMRIRSLEKTAKQLRAASHSPILQHTGPDIDAASWRNRERASSEPSHGIECPSVGQQQQGESAMGKFIDPFTQQVGDIRSYESTTPTDLARRHGRSASRDDLARRAHQTQSSLHQLGMRLDTETVDFLTSLRFGSAGSSHSSEDLQEGS
jgi:hypothetical protein